MQRPQQEVIEKKEPLEPVQPILHATATFSDATLFFNIKGYLGAEDWGEFLKALLLYNVGILTKPELVFLFRDLVLREESGMSYFKEFCAFLKLSSDDFMDMDVPLADLDLSNCERSGASYWRRPESYKLKPCSGRSPLCDSVLNDTWLSRPTGP
jgi:paired amphipathic helix protein Sin3a